MEASCGQENSAGAGAPANSGIQGGDPVLLCLDTFLCHERRHMPLPHPTVPSCPKMGMRRRVAHRGFCRTLDGSGQRAVHGRRFPGRRQSVSRTTTNLFEETERPFGVRPFGSAVAMAVSVCRTAGWVGQGLDWPLHPGRVAAAETADGRGEGHGPAHSVMGRSVFDPAAGGWPRSAVFCRPRGWCWAEGLLLVGPSPRRKPHSGERLHPRPARCGRGRRACPKEANRRSGRLGRSDVH